MAHYDCWCCGQYMGISPEHCDSCKGGRCGKDHTLGKPSASDPLGQRPDPADAGDMLNVLIDARIEQRLRGRTANGKFDGVPDVLLVQELMARGWACFLPAMNKAGGQ